MLREGSITSCKSENSLEYLVGSFSHVLRRRETEPCPRPLKMANMELKFFTCLQYLAILTKCLSILLRLTRFNSAVTSVETQNISLLTNSSNFSSMGSPYLESLSNRSSMNSVGSISENISKSCNVN